MIKLFLSLCGLIPLFGPCFAKKTSQDGTSRSLRIRTVLGNSLTRSSSHTLRSCKPSVFHSGPYELPALSRGGSHSPAASTIPNAPAVDAVDNVTHNDDDGFSLEAFGYHRTSDQLAVPSAFLDSYENDALESRGQALRWVQEAAAQEENIGNKKIKGSSATTRGPTSETMKRMMEANDSSAKLKKGNGGTGDGIDDESPAEYCSSMNIRKLVKDMIAAGWRPVPVSFVSLHVPSISQILKQIKTHSSQPF